MGINAYKSLSNCKLSPAKLRWITGLVLVVGIILLLTGCPDPNREIEFQKGSKRVEKLEIPLVKDSLKLVLQGTGGCRYGSNDFVLNYYIELYCHEECDDIIYYPDSLELFLCNKRIAIRHLEQYKTNFKKHWVVKRYGIDVRLNARECLLELDRNDAFDTNFLKLYFGNMVYFRREKIGIDTIYAYDPKAKSAQH